MNSAAMANNSRAAMHLLGDLLAHLGHHVLALLHMCGLHHCVHLCLTHLVCFCVTLVLYCSVVNSPADWMSMAMCHIMTLRMAASLTQNTGGLQKEEKGSVTLVLYCSVVKNK